MNVLRSIIVFAWLVITLIPAGLALLAASLFLSSDRLWWLIAAPWLRGVIFMARWVGGVRYRVRGWENLPGPAESGRFILCPKHQSTWETFFLPSISPRPLAYVFKQELLRIPFFGWSLGRLGMIHIDRSKRSEAWKKVARQGVKLMDEGKWIIMFPEGTRTERGKQGVYKAGASRLGVTTGASLIPIALASGRCWPRRSFWFIPGVIDVSIGSPIKPDGLSPDEMMRQVESWIETEMRVLDPEAYVGESG